MRARMWRSCVLSLVVASALPLTLAPIAAVHAQTTGTPEPSAPVRPAGAISSIDDASAAPDAAPQPKLTEDLQQLSRSKPASYTTVEINGADAAVKSAVTTNGGTVISGAAGLTLAKLPASKLSSVAAAPGVESVRKPVELKDGMIRRTNTGVYNADHGVLADDWHHYGYTGAGSKVGIISYFDPTVLATEIANGEFADVPANHRICLDAGQACTFGSPGYTDGNSLAEIVADGAPSVQLYLAEPGTVSDFYAIIDWFFANGVTILVNPLIPAYDGPGDGTGPSAAIVDYAVAKGITWFNGMGNFAPNYAYGYNYTGGYWRGTWSDPDNDRWLNFSGTDESLTVLCGALLGLRWSDWHAAVKTDYDLYISDFNASTRGNGTKKLLSGFNQAAGALPLEGNNLTLLCNTDPNRGPVYDTNGDGYVSLWVQKTTRTTGTPVGDILEIGTKWGYIEYSTDAGSGDLPFADSANPGEASVGGTLSGGTKYSSPGTGPTNDGRLKPDFVQPNCVSTSVDGVSFTLGGCDNYGYYGTEGSAAVAASWAALLRGPVGFVLPKDVVRYFRDNSTPGGLGLAPPDFHVGWGTFWPPLNHLQPSQPSAFIPEATPTRILETRSINGAPPIGVSTPGALPAATTLALHLPGDVASSYPSAVLLNVGIVNAPQPGWLGVYPHAYSFAGGTSVLNVDTIGQTRSNQVVVPMQLGGQIDLYTSNGGNVIVDVLGYFAGDGNQGAGSGRLRDVTPTTVLDSKACIGITSCTGSKLAEGSYTDLNVHGFTDPNDPLKVVPNDATAVALSVTVDDPAAGGWLTVLPGDQTAIKSSNLNYEAGKAATALAFVRVGGTANGVARFYLSRSAHLKVTILGWFTGTQGFQDPYGMFVSLNPRRLIDTRLPPISAKSVAGSSTTVQLSAGNVPADAPVVLVDNVATQTTGAGIVQAAPIAPVGTPTRADLTVSAANQTIAASTITRTHSGTFVLATTTTTHLISDVAGYFLPRPDTPLPGGPAQLLTPGTGGHGITADAYIDGMANDGSVVVFHSTAADVVPGDVNGQSDWFVWRKAGNTVTRLNPSLGITGLALSGNGATLVFQTVAQLLPADTNSTADVYAMKLADSSLTLVSLNSGGTVATGFGEYSAYPSVSDDGNLVAFQSNAALVNSDSDGGALDAYMRDVSGGTTRLVSTAATSSINSPPRITRNGALIEYAADSLLHWYTIAASTEVTTTPSGEIRDISADGSTYSYLKYDSGSYLLTVRTRATGVDHIVSVGYPNSYCYCAAAEQLSADGTKVLLIDKDTKRLRVMDVASSTGTLVDVTWDGDLPSGSVLSATMSPDGRYVVFSTKAFNMLQTATTASGNVFLVDLGA